MNKKFKFIIFLILFIIISFLPSICFLNVKNDNVIVRSKSKNIKPVDLKVVSAIKNDIKTDYNPKYVHLSKYDREKTERLVTGEAGVLGYEGCVLVAQTIRDSMNLTGTSSIDKIIKDYKYKGSTINKATDDAVKAVSYVFDEGGYGVNHRILYFYAPNLKESKWHETQKYITRCGNMKFFDKW